MSQVTFQIEGASPVIIECNDGDNLLELARRANVAIDAPCSGNGSCGKCRVKLVEGELESPRSRHISDEEYAEGWRLSCSSKVRSDCTVFVPDIASAYQSRMKTADLSSPKEVAIFDECQENLKKSGINAVNIGMFPDVEIEKFHYIGNSSLTGSYAMVMSDEANAKCAEVSANMTYLELSTYPGYMDSFVAACFLPHTDRSLFPHSVQER